MARSLEFNQTDALEKCMHIFWDKGFDSTSISDLEKGTGLVRTSLYNAFGNKDRVFEMVLDHFVDTQCRYWINIFKKSPSIIDGIDKLLTTVITENGDPDYPTGCLVTFNVMGIERHTDGNREKLKNGHRLMQQELKGALKRAVERGELKQIDNLDGLAFYLLNNLQGIMVLSRSLGDEAEFNAIKSHIISTLEAFKA